MPQNAVALPGGLVLRPAAPADFGATARVHCEFLPVGLFPAMGPAFLRRWHRTFLRVPHGIALVVLDPSARVEVVGFLLGTTDQVSHTAALLADRRLVGELTLWGSVALLRRPRLLLRFLRTRGRPWLRRLLRRSEPRPQPAGRKRRPATAVLAAIAVTRQARGRGVGTHLVRHFLAAARAAGADVAELVTEAPGGDVSGAGFYERLGWRPTGDRSTRDGTMVRTYAYPLRSARPAATEERNP